MVRQMMVVVGGIALVAGMAGCANMNDTQRSTATGAVIGAGAGAVVGNVTGGNPRTGAVVGGAVGAAVGNSRAR